MSSRHNNRDVAIAGGGIGGLTAAIALRRSGARVRVYERATQLATAQAGHGLVLWHNAVAAFQAIGLADLPGSIGHVLERHQFWSFRGGQLSNWPLDEYGVRFDAPAYTVERPALHRALCDEVGDDLELGARFVNYVESADGVTVQFSDGREVRADLLIGADGIRSSVRGQMRPYEPPPRYAGFTAWQGISDVVPEGTVPHTFMGVWGRGRWFVYYQLPNGRVYWDGIVSDQILGAMDSVGEDRSDILNRLFGNWAQPIPGLIAATQSQNITPVDIFDRDPVSGWGTDRVVLVGDAAHPMTFNLGQGANQAIEGAVTLATCLANEPDLSLALRSYESQRAKRVATMMKRSRANGEMTRWHGHVSSRFRDLVLRTILDRIVVKKTYGLTMGFEPFNVPIAAELESVT